MRRGERVSDICDSPPLRFPRTILVPFPAYFIVVERGCSVVMVKCREILRHEPIVSSSRLMKYDTSRQLHCQRRCRAFRRFRHSCFIIFRLQDISEHLRFLSRADRIPLNSTEIAATYAIFCMIAFFFITHTASLPRAFADFHFLLYFHFISWLRRWPAADTPFYASHFFAYFHATAIATISPLFLLPLFSPLPAYFRFFS